MIFLNYPFPNFWISYITSGKPLLFVIKILRKVVSKKNIYSSSCNICRSSRWSIAIHNCFVAHGQLGVKATNTRIVGRQFAYLLISNCPRWRVQADVTSPHVAQHWTNRSCTASLPWSKPLWSPRKSRRSIPEIMAVIVPKGAAALKPLSSCVRGGGWLY